MLLGLFFKMIEEIFIDAAGNKYLLKKTRNNFVVRSKLLINN